MSGLGNIHWKDIKGAIASGLFMALFAMILYVIEIKDVFKIEWRVLINIGIMAGLTSFVSIMKSFFTDSKGNLFGKVKVK